MGKNEDLAEEALIVLDLVEIVEQNMKGAEDEKIVINMDCIKVWESLMSKKLKASQLVRDSSSIISKMVELENKSQTEFEHANAKAKDNENNSIENKVVEIVLKCDKKRKKKEFSA